MAVNPSIYISHRISWFSLWHFFFSSGGLSVNDEWRSTVPQIIKKLPHRVHRPFLPSSTFLITNRLNKTRNGPNTKKSSYAFVCQQITIPDLAFCHWSCQSPIWVSMQHFYLYCLHLNVLSNILSSLPHTCIVCSNLKRILITLLFSGSRH